MTKLIGLLFSEPMAAANMENDKSETRRTRGMQEINENPDDWQFEWGDFALKYPFRFTQRSSLNATSIKNKTFYQAELKCPYGRPGDILWMRETWAPVENGVIYKSDIRPNDNKPPLENVKWRPNMHMPLLACRYFARIEKITVGRLHDVTGTNAIAEGAMFWISNYTGRDGKPDLEWMRLSSVHGEDTRFCNEKGAYMALWESINGKGSSDSNPWLWIVKYKRLHAGELLSMMPEIDFSCNQQLKDFNYAISKL